MYDLMLCQVILDFYGLDFLWVEFTVSRKKRTKHPFVLLPPLFNEQEIYQTPDS